MTQATLAELAEMVEGKLSGSGDILIHDVAPLHVVCPGQITFVDKLERCKCLAERSPAAVLISSTIEPSELDFPSIQVTDIHEAVAKIVQHFRPARSPKRIGISTGAFVSESAKIGDNVDIFPFAFIGEDVEIGDNCTIHSGARILEGSRVANDVTIFPNAVLYEDTVVGQRCIIHSGAILGAYGFGYDSSERGHKLSYQLGNVVVEDDVEIGSGSTIDRGTYCSTVIGEGTKIDNLVMIAHNCRIGKHNLLCAQVGIAGSTTTGDYVIMAGQAGVRDHVHIGAGAVLGAMAGVMSDIPARGRYVGIPATPEREQMLKQAAFMKLPEMRKQIRWMANTLDKLVKKIGLDD